MPPKLPRGMILRNGTYYWRDRRGGRAEHWHNLGRDLTRARVRFWVLKNADQAPPQRITVEQAAKRWLDEYVSVRRHGKGPRIAAARIARFLSPFLGRVQLSKLNREALWRYRRWLDQQTHKGTRLSPQTVHHVLADARAVLLWCKDVGLLEHSPFPRQVMPEIQERRPDSLSDEEAKLVQNLPEPYGFVIRLGLGTGLRWGEMCRAQASDVERGCLVVHHTKSYRLRRVPLPEPLLCEIQGRVGRLVPFSVESAGTFNRTVRRLAELHRFHVHQLRHTFACRYLEHRGTLPSLQEILGHSQIKTTQRYARLAEATVRAEADEVFARMAGA